MNENVMDFYFFNVKINIFEIMNCVFVFVECMYLMLKNFYFLIFVKINVNLMLFEIFINVFI